LRLEFYSRENLRKRKGGRERETHTNTHNKIQQRRFWLKAILLRKAEVNILSKEKQ
jgi:hypothetical protein